jgi:hypothetical protein
MKVKSNSLVSLGWEISEVSLDKEKADLVRKILVGFCESGVLAGV